MDMQVGGLFPPSDSSTSEGVPADPKAMMINVLSKYRKGLNIMFDFYRKANAGSVPQATFDQRREELGVSTLSCSVTCASSSI